MYHLKKTAYPLLNITDETWEDFASKCELVEVPKKTTILKIGQQEDYLNFLEHGAVRSFIRHLDQEKTLRFYFSGTFFNGFSSFVTRQPSDYELEALTDCTYWRISHENLEKFYAGSIEGNIVGRIAAEYVYIKSVAREISILTRSAEERYIELFELQPELIKTIQLKYIASYLGITPQALSRIRRRIF